jgi:recombination protein RecA
MGTNHYEQLVKDALGGSRKLHHPPMLKFGIPSLDHFLGGGIFSGLTEIYGPESSGKTYLMAHAARQAQDGGRLVGWCPTEDVDIQYIERLGVNPWGVVLIRDNNVDFMIDQMVELIKEPALLVIDSLTALVRRDSDFNDWMDLADDLLNRFHGAHPGAHILVSSQVRQQRSACPGRQFSKGIRSASDRLFEHFNIVMQLGRQAESDNTYEMVVDVKKNRMGMMGRVLVPVPKGRPVDFERDLVDLSIRLGLLELAGSYVRLYGNNIGQGRDGAAEKIRQNPDLKGLLLDKIFHRVKSGMA